MERTSLKQKLLLIIFGLFLSLILLEVGLRIAGGIVLYLQERHNHLSSNPNEYRILCLGESTTALGGEDSYPSQLEEMLNTQSRQKKFTVINRGRISTTSDYILTHLEQNLDKYKPQLVIVMMGINDYAYMHDPNKTLWWENIKFFLKDFRVYKLAHLLYEHISHRIKRINNPAGAVELSLPDESNYQQIEQFLKFVIVKSIEGYKDHLYRKEYQSAQQSITQITLAYVELAKRYRIKGFFKEAQNILEAAISLNPHNAAIYQELGELYLTQGEYPEAVKFFQAALSLDPKNSAILRGLARSYYQEHNPEAFLVYAKYLQMNPKDYWGLIELAKWLREYKQYDLAQGYLTHAIDVGLDFEQAYLDMGRTLDDQGQFQKEEAFYLKEISLHPKIPHIYQAIGDFYMKQGKENLAREYFKKAAQQKIAEFYPATFVNYALVLNRILRQNIKVIVMQYPVRDISPLKDYLGERKGVIFVENRQNFKQALNTREFSYYFKDNFAYDFGHCTHEGNEMIARNLADVILKQQ